ncbi:hypothetical protein [Streptomyces collinus]|uniref:hypothetical protein n=1 Tax=Streptomyces collinus TaxID=42684 RepID=UPI00369E6698
MSRSADIDLMFARAVTVEAVVRALAGEGWSLQEPLGISYVVNDDDLFNWQSASSEQAAEVLALVDSPANVNHNVGVCICHSTAETGGQLICHAADRAASSSRRSTGAVSPEHRPSRTWPGI